MFLQIVSFQHNSLLSVPPRCKMHKLVQKMNKMLLAKDSLIHRHIYKACLVKVSGTKCLSPFELISENLFS